MQIITVLLNITVTQYLHIINLSLNFPAIKKLKIQVKRVMDKEKQKENLDFFDIFFGKMEGILWKKTQSCLLVAQ